MEFSGVRGGGGNSESGGHVRVLGHCLKTIRGFWGRKTPAIKRKETRGSRGIEIFGLGGGGVDRPLNGGGKKALGNLRKSSS